MFETKEKWDTERFWLEWRKLPNRNKFTINNHDFKVYSGSTNLELSCLRCKKSFEITVRRFFEWKKCIYCHPLPSPNNTSIGEVFIANYLADNKIQFRQQERFKTCKRHTYLPFDFYLPQYDILIELQGAHHFIPTSFSSDKSQVAKEKNLYDVQERDEIKRQWAKDNDYILIELRYSDLNDLSAILRYYINQNINI